MLSDDELITLWGGGEADRIDFKESARDLDDIRKYVCAFANDLPGHRKPGVLLIGVRNDGTCAGLRIDDDLMNRLSNCRTDGAILPLPVLRIGRRSLQGCDLVVVEVEPADQPPVQIRGTIWVRTGTVVHRASPFEERRLIERRTAGDRPFDGQPVPEASLADLDLSLFERDYLPAAIAPEILAQNNRTIDQKLAALRFLDPSGVPTVGGILALGKDPRRFIPGAYIQFLRVDGPDLLSPIANSLEIDGPLPDVFQRVDDILRANIATRSDILSGSREIRKPDYPFVALQQLVNNGIVHRTYSGSNAPLRLYWFSDRVEITSPGGPYGMVNSGNFGAPNIADYRNPVLAEVARNLGYIQRFGMGIMLARTALANNGNPPPEFQIAGEYILATVRIVP